MKRLLPLLCLLFAGCGYSKKEVPLYTYDNPTVAIMSARLHAKDVGGRATGPIGSTNSMLPTIQAGDWLVIKPTAFSDDLLGKVVEYAPKWYPQGTVAHRLVTGSAKKGFISSGDNNPRSESFELVTAETYRGEVVGIYRYVK